MKINKIKRDLVLVVDSYDEPYFKTLTSIEWRLYKEFNKLVKKIYYHYYGKPLPESMFVKLGKRQDTIVKILVDKYKWHKYQFRQKYILIEERYSKEQMDKMEIERNT
ncbi:MAG: hypothetical protein ACYDCN_13705 [Bacteroidia bacterium]